MVIGLDFFRKEILAIESLPIIYQHIFTVAFFMVLIFVYSIFIWKVYRAISRKDIISLNLGQYNYLEHAVLKKILAGILYFIEYIIILPFLILFWYVLFALVLLFFSENLSLEQILLLSAAVVGSIRLLAYYKQEIAMDVAKLLPFTILAIILLSPRFLDVGRFLDSINQIPELILSVGSILFFVVGLEIVLRFLDLLKRILVDSDN
ncbi:hypothetical protein J4416_03265 [Candidatus Pacearchaeota archaeon]|nr:hypothetical protein [Candidatus Pacearchaeota archaeon]